MNNNKNRVDKKQSANKLNEQVFSREAVMLAIQDLLNDEQFVYEHVINNPTVKKAVIEEYLREVSCNKSLPRLLGASVGVSAMSPHFKPKTLEEAKVLADVLLKSNNY